jgi:hypothetical protein
MPKYVQSSLHCETIDVLHCVVSLLLNKPSDLLALPDRYDCSLPNPDTKDITPGRIGRLRNEVRKRLADELREIDGLVQRILKK